jgi:aminopeptidase N
MRRFLIATLTASALLAAAGLGAAPPAGRLPVTVRPTAYRLELNVDPAAKSFTGRTEIDAVLTETVRTIYLHGNGLRVSHSSATTSAGTASARYSEVDPTGVAQLDFDRDLAPGAMTLTFEYAADFRIGSEGLFHAEAGGEWYAWTQLEATDARRMFPSFDEPGFKTPFTVTVTAPRGAKVFGNTPEVESRAEGDLTVHRFAPSKPLPTYLVAIGVGPFDVAATTVPPNSVRAEPLAFRVIATRGQAPRMKIALEEVPKFVAGLERYLGTPYPFEKLDFLASPTHTSAMENAGLVIFQDSYILLDDTAPARQLRNFSEVSAHELAHQWFGNLVTPVWWTDIWLNEAFATWLGKRVADEWRPDLGMGVTELASAVEAMDTDALSEGREIRQEITDNRQIDSAFDGITYWKGSQVLSMFEAYLGRDRFRDGVRLHLSRFRYGNATADDFFDSLARASDNPSVVPALRTFTDQTGVPIVSVDTRGNRIAVTQTRYQRLGSELLPARTWKIPLCLTRGERASCSLLDTAAATLPAVEGTGALLPNAGGAGYYRFRLDPAEWDRLVASAAALPGRDAVALADSVWADFAAGTGSFARVVAAARELSGHQERLAATYLSGPLEYVGESMLAAEQAAAFRRLVSSIYAPRLAALGFDPRLGAHKSDPVATQTLRETLVPVVARVARDSAVRALLSEAAARYVDGDPEALDPAYFAVGLGVAVQDRGVPFMTKLKAAIVATSAPDFRRQAVGSLGAADTPELAAAALELASSGLQPLEATQVLIVLARWSGSRAVATRYADENFERVAGSLPAFARERMLPSLFQGLCSAEDAARVDAFVRRNREALGGRELGFVRMKERIALCAALKDAKATDIAAVLAAVEVEKPR